MNSGDESLGFEDLLCPMCLDVYEGRLAKAEEAVEKDEGRQAKDIYQMERDAQEMEIRIQESLPPEMRAECWLLVASVMGLAEVRAKRAVSDWAEQGMLYNILMAEAWKATESYDPAKSKFSTWVFRPWGYAIKEFWRVKRLQTESLSASGNDPDNQSTLQDQIEDPDSTSPEEGLISSELSIWMESTPFWEIITADTCQQNSQQYQWLCPFCRKRIRDAYSQLKLQRNKYFDFTKNAFPNVFSRYHLWLALESNFKDAAAIGRITEINMK